MLSDVKNMVEEVDPTLPASWAAQNQTRSQVFGQQRGSRFEPPQSVFFSSSQLLHPGPAFLLAHSCVT